MDNQFPCAVDCYLLEARDGMPPHPMDEPVETIVVDSQQELEEARKDLIEKHPGGWVVERPVDIR